MNDLSNRVLVLERQLQEMQAELVSTRRMFVPQNSPRRVRIARVAQLPSGEADKYGIVFQDGTFDETLSPGAATFSDRSGAIQKIAYNIGAKNAAINDRVFAFEMGDKWWFRVDDGSTIISGTSVSETVSLYRCRYFYTTTGIAYRADTGSSTNDRLYDGLHIPLTDATSGIRTLFDLSWDYIANPQSWFELDSVAPGPGKYCITDGGLYLVTITVDASPFHIDSPGVSSTDEAMSLFVIEHPSRQLLNDCNMSIRTLASVWFPTSLAGTSSFTDPHSAALFTQVSTAQSRMSCTTAGLVLPISSGAYAGKRPFSFRSQLSYSNTDYGINPDDIVIHITRVVGSDVFGACPSLQVYS